jgi:hypothetical protein
MVQSHEPLMSWHGLFAVPATEEWTRLKAGVTVSEWRERG